MSRKVLVLNQDFRALTVCSVQRAFILVFSKKAELVTNDKTKMLRTVSASYPMPSIIRLNRYVNLPYKGVLLNRQNIFRRDGYKCQYCGCNYDLTLDHVIPKSRGGETTWENLVTACKSCNSKKGDRTPKEAEMPLARKPFKPSFVMFLRDFAGYLDDDWMLYLGTKRK